MNRRWRSLGWVGILTIFVIALSIAGLGHRSTPTNSERALRLAGQFACPQCEGQAVANSDAGIAVAIRTEIRKRVDQGQTDREITDFLIGSFSESISLKPRATGVVGLIWITPVVALVTACGGLVVVFRRWRREAPGTPPSDDDRVLVGRARAARAATAAGGAGEGAQVDGR